MLILQPTKPDPNQNWHVVGIFRGLNQTVTNFIDHDEWNSPMFNGLTSENLPDLTQYTRINLEPGTAYRFRLCAINGCGRSEWGEVYIYIQIL